MRKYVAVAISKKPETLSLGIPFYCLAEESRLDRYKQQREETYYVCEKRNRAMTSALDKYPQSTHALSLDSYYLDQTAALKELLNAYEALNDDNIILGAPIWYYRKNRLIDNRPKFYDSWGSPELTNIRPKDAADFPKFVQAPSIGNCIIFPIWIWRKYGFLTPEPFPIMGSCYTRLCKISGLPVFIDMRATLVRDRTNNPEAYYPFPKRARVSIGDFKGRLFRLLRIGS